MIELLTGQRKTLYTQFLEFFSSRIAPYSVAWEKNQAISREAIALCGQSGFLGATLPDEYGGLDWDAVTYGIFNEAVASASCSLSGLFNVHTMVEQAILKWGSEAQRLRWLHAMSRAEILGAFALTEAAAGSDIQGIKTEYAEVEGGLLLNGAKRWITFGEIADIFLVFGKLEGKPIAAIVERDTPGLSIAPIKDMLGFRCGHLAKLEFSDCRISKENVIAKPGFAFTHIAPYALEYGRISVAFAALGILRSCMEVCSTHVQKRKAFDARLIEHGSIREMIANMGVDLEAAKLLCLNACSAKNDHHPRATEKIMIAKYFTSCAAVRHSACAVQIMGALGCNENCVVSRHYRDAKTLEIIEGSNQIHQMLLGKSFARHYKRN